MTLYAYEVVRRHMWLHQIREGTGKHPDKAHETIMALMPKEKTHLKIWLYTLWRSELAMELGVAWHTAIEPFCLELRKDEKWFKHDSEDYYKCWRFLTKRYHLLILEDDVAEDERNVESRSTDRLK